MYEFKMEGPIVVETKEEIVESLREIANNIETGIERDFIPGECQCMEWTVGEAEEVEDI